MLGVLLHLSHLVAVRKGSEARRAKVRDRSKSSHMPQSASGNYKIRFSHLEDCGTFEVIVLFFVSKTKEAMQSSCLCLGSLHCSPTGPGPNNGAERENPPCPDLKLIDDGSGNNKTDLKESNQYKYKLKFGRGNKKHIYFF